MRINKQLHDERGRFRLERNQIGFRYGLGCEVNIMRLVESLRTLRDFNKNSTQKTWSFFVDLKSAFDSVNHRLLFQKMDRIGIPLDLNNTIQ